MDLHVVRSRLTEIQRLETWAVAVRHRDDSACTAAGAATDAVFPIASLSKPVLAILTMCLVHEGVVALDDDVVTWLPESSSLQVATDLEHGLGSTAPLEGPVTIRHLLTMTSGFGVRYAGDAVDEAMRERGIAPVPASLPLSADDFLRRLMSLPLAAQPGAEWRYHTSSQVLSIVLARAAGAGLDDLVESRICRPLHLTTLRFAPTDGFLSLGEGLVSNAADYLTVLDELVSPTVLPTDLAHLIRRPALSDDVCATASAFFEPGCSYGFQGAVNLVDRPRRGRAGAYGWSGGTGCVAQVDPAADVTAVLLSTLPMLSPTEQPHFAAFFDGVAELTGLSA